MKKFGTPTRPGPGVGGENVGCAGEGGAAVEDDPREVPATSRGLSGFAVVGGAGSHESSALPRASEGRRPPPARVRPAGAPATKSLAPVALPPASAAARRRRRSATAARRCRSRAAAAAAWSQADGVDEGESVVVVVVVDSAVLVVVGGWVEVPDDDGVRSARDPCLACWARSAPLGAPRVPRGGADAGGSSAALGATTAAKPAPEAPASARTRTARRWVTAARRAWAACRGGSPCEGASLIARRSPFPLRALGSDRPLRAVFCPSR